jgi:hypothetical protein
MLERLIALSAMAYSILVTFRIWDLVSPHQDMWLFPGLYLLEVLLLPVIAAVLTFRSLPERTLLYTGFAGALLAFSILGALSIGIFYIPVVLLLMVAAAFSWRTFRVPIAPLLLLFFVSLAFQASLMLAIVRLIH